MHRCGPEQVNAALLAGKTTKILQIAGDLYEGPAACREALFNIVTTYESNGKKFKVRNKEALFVHIGKMLKNAKPGYTEVLFLCPWVDARLAALYEKNAPLLELSSWKDLLFVYQLTYLLKLNPVFGPSADLVLGEFERVSSPELTRLKHNAMVMAYGLEPLSLDEIINAQKKVKSLASSLAEHDWRDKDWEQFSQCVTGFNHAHEMMLEHANSIRGQFSKLRDVGIRSTENLFLDMEGLTFLQNIFSIKDELRNMFLDSLLDNVQKTIDVEGVQKFFDAVSQIIAHDFPHDYKLLLGEYKNLTETQSMLGSLEEHAPRLSALMRVCIENASVDRDDAIWEDFTGKFSRALAEGRFVLPGEGHAINEDECWPAKNGYGGTGKVDEVIFEKISKDVAVDAGFGNLDDGNIPDDAVPDGADGKDEPAFLLKGENEELSKNVDFNESATFITGNIAYDGSDDIVGEMGTLAEQDEVDADSLATNAESISSNPVCPPKILASQLVSKDQIAALYWLTKSAHMDDIPPWLAELAYLGINLRPGLVATKGRVGELIRQATKEIDALPLASAMLLAAATLRPALMMPSSEQSYIFNTLGSSMLQHNGKPLMERLAKFVTQNTPLGETIFLHHSQIAKNQEKRNQLRAQTRSFLDHAPKKTLVYAPATFAFRQLFNSSTGELGKILQACVQENFTLLRDLDLEAWSRETVIYNKLNQLEKERNRLSTKAIDFKAKDTFKRQVLIALSLLGEWKRFAAPPATVQSTSYVQQVFNEIIGDAKKFHEGLADIQDSNLWPFSAFLRKNLKKLIGKYQSNDTDDIFLDPLDSLDLWLLNVSEFTFENGQISLPVDEIGKHLDEVGKKPPIGFEKHVRKGNFALVDKYFNAFPDMEVEPCTFDPQKSNRAFFEEEFSKQFGALQAEMERINDRIEDYYLRGVIAEEKELELRGHASDLERALESDKFGISKIRDKLKNLDEQLESSGEEQRKLLQADLETLKATAPVSDDIISFFADCLEKNEISTAHEELAELQWKASNGMLLTLRDNPDDKKSNYAAKYFEDFLPNFIPGSKQLKGPEENASQYIKDWHRLFSSTSIKTFHALFTQILRLIGFELERDSKLEERGSEGSPYYWRVFKCLATIHSPLSKWGSGARGGHIIVYTPDSKVQPSELRKFLDGKMRKGELDKSTPITVLTQAMYGVTERKKLIKNGQSMNYLPLVIDTPMFYWLLSFDPQERTKALFESGLAGAPFNPYTPTVAGAVPSEMFYGREKDIESLWEPTGPCIVYGGRQLGKSALLKRVTLLYNKPQDGQYVRYEDVRSESDIVDVVLRSLRNMQIVNKATSIKTLPEAIKQFLDKNPSSRILLLLDECDLLIKSDMNKTEMPGLSTIRGVMTDTNRRFKVVLAGLESVQRYSHMPNTPFPHYGVPLCVGPLQPKPARNLVEEPMAAIGLHFESPELIQRVLVHTNHNPSLIQLFCHELVGAMHERISTGEGRLLRKISKETIAQVYRRANLRTQIRERFDWTLELDPRYKVTGYTLALMQEYSQGTGMGRGFKLREILSELADYWPQAFAKASKEEVSSILTEMEGLGIVLKFGDTYRLRSPNIINLLGGTNSIIDELSSFVNKPYNGGKALDMRPVLAVDGHTFSSPLALSQINEIKMSKTGLVLVTGSKALGLDRVGQTLQYVRDKYEIPVEQIKGINAREILSNLKKYSNAMDNSGCLAWFDCEECSDFVRTIRDIHAWLGRLRTDKKYISVIAVIGTKDVLELFINNEIRHVMESPFVRHLPLGKWSESGVDEWFHNLPEKLARPDSIIGKTGGWDYLVRHALQTGELGPEVFLEKLKRDFFMPRHPAIHTILETYQEWGEPMSAHDFWELLQGNPLFSNGEEYLERVLEALIALGVFVQVLSDDKFVLDRLLAESLSEESA